ncbi:MAG: hypothetical protein L6R39_006332 [Caloplaca ligustica]|nr:MAG: hypothetical protein L6R39_006332 [Caloplaca ligustica]
MDDDEDDGYSDDDLDALPTDAFRKLEEHAVTATQQAARGDHASFLPVSRPQSKAPAALANGLERLSVAGGPRPHQDSEYPHQQSSDYGNLDDEMLDGEIYDAAEKPGINAIQASKAASVTYGESTQREHWRQQSYGIGPTQPISVQPQVNVRPNVVRNGADIPQQNIPTAKQALSHGDDTGLGQQPDTLALQAELQALRRERDELAKAKKAAEDAALAKSGEIAIVRANQTKTERFFQAQIQELQRRHQGEAANHRLEVERALAEKQKIATEKGFLQNDLAEGNQQIRDLQRAVKAKDTASKAIRQKDDGVATLPTTPKKSKSVKHADGFDQDELQPQLPIRSKNSTPKAGSKRKRKAVAASPVKPLELSKANEALEPADTIQITSDQSFAGSDTAGAAPPAAATFSAIAPPDERFHWKPVRLLLDLTSYVLCITPVTTAPLLVDPLLGVIQSTADVNVLPRVRRQPAKFSAEVNTLDCLELLKSIAVDCSAHDEDSIKFWKNMRFDFIAMILNVVQPIKELHITLGLLHRSVLKDTFAIIVPPNDGKQEPSELNLIDLLSRLLVEPLKAAKDEEPYNAVEIAGLRLNVLSLLEEMCMNKHSSLALASSQHVIGRLVWVMNDELDALYDREYGHEERAELVNQATRILFRLRTDHPQLINMQEKLKVIPGSGGVHKHLIALTRLALSEGVFFEENIEDDVVECAYEMLEDLASPEEAEALREAFSTARSR